MSADRGGEGPEVGIRRLRHAAGLPLPEYATAGSAGLDLCCAAERIEIAPGERVVVPTGWLMEIPDGWEGQVRPRSGRALRQGLTVVNAPGTVDSDYRGEVGVLLVNLGDGTVVIERGERVAQIVFAPVARIRWREQEGEAETARGGGGFGSTGF